MSETIGSRGDTAASRLMFDTAELPSDEAFERYGALYEGTDVQRNGPGFHAQVEGWRLDRMLLYERRLNDIGHRRDARRTESDGFTQFTVTLLLSGELEVDVDDGARFRPRPGEVLLLDTHVPGTNRMRHAHLVTVAVARERLAAIASDVDALHGVILAADEARLFREFVESLLRNLPTMSQAAMMAAAGVLVGLLGIAIADHAAEPRAGVSLRDIDRLGQIKRLIDARIGDPNFDLAAAIRESGLSRATLYRLVESEGGLATLIRHRRLESIRRRLGDPAETRAFADLVDAAGLPSVSHASRSFVERYGLRPSDYREMASTGEGADALFKMRFWQEELR